MKLKFEYENKEMIAQVTYKKRKTLQIAIIPPNHIKVSAPVGIKEDFIIEKVRSKGRWIVKKLKELEEVNYENIQKEFVNEEAFLYLGKEYPLYIQISHDIKKAIIKIHQEKLHIISPTEDTKQIKKELELWYREQGIIKIKERVDYYKAYFNKEPLRIKVKEQKKRWASCTSDGRILFNWRCIMAPLKVLDYIVVHEMAHLEHFNHSKAFWNKVKVVKPDYEEGKAWLKKFGPLMNL